MTVQAAESNGASTGRKSLSKRTRFEIFKRDGFRCSYCGTTPVQAALRIDHVVPVSKGGSSDPSNLITACFDCNAGKSDVPLEKRVHAPTMSAEDAREHAEQIREYLSAQRDIVDAKRDITGLVEKHWEETVGWSLTDRQRASVAYFLTRLDIQVVTEAVTVAASKIAPDTASLASKCFAYFCGICWRKIKDPQSAQVDALSAGASAVASVLPEATSSPKAPGGDDSEDAEEEEGSRMFWRGFGWGDTLCAEVVAKVIDVEQSVSRLSMQVDWRDPCILSTREVYGNPIRRYLEQTGEREPLIEVDLRKMGEHDIVPMFDRQAVRLLVLKKRPVLLSFPWRSISLFIERSADDAVVRWWSLSPKSHFAMLIEQRSGE